MISLFVMAGALGGGWFASTLMACVVSGQDQFTPQARWLASTVGKPFVFTGKLLGAPGRLLRDYWAHKESIRQLDTDTSNRIRLLEGLVADEIINKDNQSK